MSSDFRFWPPYSEGDSQHCGVGVVMEVMVLKWFHIFAGLPGKGLKAEVFLVTQMTRWRVLPHSECPVLRLPYFPLALWCCSFWVVWKNSTVTITLPFSSLCALQLSETDLPRDEVFADKLGPTRTLRCHFFSFYWVTMQITVIEGWYLQWQQWQTQETCQKHVCLLYS